MSGSKAKHIPVDLPWWENLVKMTDGRNLITKGFADLSLEAPGRGIELNDEVVKEYLHATTKVILNQLLNGMINDHKMKN